MVGGCGDERGRTVTWWTDKADYALSTDAVADRFDQVVTLLQEGETAEQWVLAGLVLATLQASHLREAREVGVDLETFQAALLLIAGKAGLVLQDAAESEPS